MHTENLKRNLRNKDFECALKVNKINLEEQQTNFLDSSRNDESCLQQLAKIKRKYARFLPRQ